MTAENVIENPAGKEDAGANSCSKEYMRKKWMLFALAICLLAGVTGSVAYAYLIDQKETVNQINIVENNTHIEEEFEPPKDPKPGQSIKKKPCIVNDSVIPVYVRVKVVFNNAEAQAQCEPLTINSSWKEEDGYYYYQKILEPGQRTETVFDNIVIKNTVKNEELVPFEILVYEESVQSEGFLTPEEAFSGL